MNNDNPETVRSLQEFIKLISEDVSKNNKKITTLYRGQRDADWSLLPKVVRITANNKSIVSIEHKILEEFKRQSYPFVGKYTLKNDWDWLALAQHHGLPTRLLDWSSNPLIALWFAVTKQENIKKNGVIWMFRPKNEDFVIDTDKENPFEGKKTNVFKPNHIGERIRVQSGYFTVHKYLEKKCKFIPFENNVLYKTRLKKILISGKAFQKIKIELSQLGVNQAVLYPDLDGLCADIEWKFKKEANSGISMESKEK